MVLQGQIVSKAQVLSDLFATSSLHLFDCVQIVVSGYNHKLPVLLEAVMKQLRGLQVRWVCFYYYVWLHEAALFFTAVF